MHSFVILIFFFLFILFMQNPVIVKEYTGHSANTTVARYSPSGYYVASGGKLVTLFRITSSNQ